MEQRRAVLVVQHLERVAGAAPDEFPEALREFIRGRNGVYALYNGDRLYYVGLASNMRSRLRGHLRDRPGEPVHPAGEEHRRPFESVQKRELLEMPLAVPGGPEFRPIRVTDHAPGRQEDLAHVLQVPHRDQVFEAEELPGGDNQCQHHGKTAEDSAGDEIRREDGRMPARHVRHSEIETYHRMHA